MTIDWHQAYLEGKGNVTRNVREFRFLFLLADKMENTICDIIVFCLILGTGPSRFLGLTFHEYSLPVLLLNDSELRIIVYLLDNSNTK